MRIENVDERHFYEIEAVKNNWSLSELKNIEFREQKVSMNFGNFIQMNCKFEFMIPELNLSGYFSIDKKGHMINSKVKRKETTSDDIDAYDLIMKNKELFLDCNPNCSPVRFIFSHSALREGWDNPNVFQICTLKQSSSEVRKRQEVGRGLRLCVNQDGERMDVNVLGNDVQNVNVLTVIASESYENFAKGLQTEIAEAVADRPKRVTQDLFVDYVVKDARGNELLITSDMASAIHFDLIINGYINKIGELTDKYYQDKANGEIKVAEEVQDYTIRRSSLLRLAV